MASGRFSTADLSSADQFDAWHAWFSPILDMALAERPAAGFSATNRVWNLGGLVASSVSAPPVRVARTRETIAKDPVDHWVLSCCTLGTTTIETRDGGFRARPGEPFLWSLGEASTSERTRVDRIQILLPRDRFRDIGPALDQHCGGVVRGPLGAILGGYLAQLGRWLDAAPADALPPLGEAVTGMIAACLAPGVAQADPDAEPCDRRLDRARQIIRRRLRAPDLGPEDLGARLGMSRTAVYRLFEASGGVMQAIRRERLAYAHARLSDPRERRPVAALGEEICFGDAASFGRAFRREFGRSPTEVRRAALSGEAQGRPPLRPTFDVSRFTDFVLASGI